ncbi:MULTISPECIES: acetolactate synthase 2 small subunit [Arsenophonus]|jgi:acetolactate synthase II small subunit|uniref:acetolactate synthase 2 small subunit n=1 Tax=Arsenophonus TaxID=637 RepID=UPI0015D7BFBC|nr:MULTISPECIES: acetolactate synthase 2 small subunit [Arsenophonus]UBX29289.1 acetolactate synthase 2 small subunit [Arsenophonus apicola]
MRHYRLNIEARFRPEILERILRVTRHRGFQVNAIIMNQRSDGNNVSIEITVNSQRPLNILCSQLIKLVDVFDIEIKQQAVKQSIVM